MSLFVARIKGFVRFKDLMGQLVSRDLKLKYRRSVLGYLWSVLNPLFIMIIMAIVFSKMFTGHFMVKFHHVAAVTYQYGCTGVSAGTAI